MRTTDLFAAFLGLSGAVFYLSGSISLFPAFRLYDEAPLQLIVAGALYTVSSLFALASIVLRARRKGNAVSGVDVFFAVLAIIASLILLVATTRLVPRYGSKGKTEAPKIYASGCGVFLAVALAEIVRLVRRKRMGGPSARERLIVGMFTCVAIAAVLLIFACVCVLDDRRFVIGVWLFVVGSVAAILARSFQLAHALTRDT